MQVKEFNQALFAVAWQQLQDRKSHNNLIEQKCREGLRECQKDLASAWFCDVLKIWYCQWCQEEFEEKLEEVEADRRLIAAQENFLRKLKEMSDVKE